MEIAIIIVIIIGIGVLLSRREESWIDKAQEKQDKRFEYLNKPLLEGEDPNKEWDEVQHKWIDKEEEARKEKYKKYHENLPPGYEQWRKQVKEEIRIKHKIVKNRTFEEYIDDHRKDGYQGNRKDKVRWYPTGWTYNDKTKLWEPPDYLSKESSEKWRWDPDKRIWIDKEKETRMERYRKYHEGQPPTFEEWKAQRGKEKQEQK